MPVNFPAGEVVFAEGHAGRFVHHRFGQGQNGLQRARRAREPGHRPGRAPQENAQKDQSEWVTGDEPMTGPRSAVTRTRWRRKLARKPGAVLVLVEGRTSRSELIERTGGAQPSGHELAEFAAKLDTLVAELGA
jgi:hypothetical protein